jgi:hypothetical protein
MNSARGHRWSTFYVSTIIICYVLPSLLHDIVLGQIDLGKSGQIYFPEGILLTPFGN